MIFPKLEKLDEKKPWNENQKKMSFMSFLKNKRKNANEK